MKPTHRYTGPTTRWGLHAGAKVQAERGRGRGGLVRVVTADGRVWRVPRTQLESL